MKISSVSTGIFGRILLHLCKIKQQEGKLKNEEDEIGNKLRKFSSGDIVGVFQSQGGSKINGPQNDKVEGIVHKVTNSEILISFNEMHDFENFKQPLNIALLANQVTYERCKNALESATKLFD